MKAIILAAAALAAVIGSARAENGIASHYSTGEQGIRTASGRSLHDGALTAAHKGLPSAAACALPTTPMGAVSSSRLPIGGLISGRVIDLTTAGARALGFSGIAPLAWRGLARVVAPP